MKQTGFDQQCTWMKNFMPLWVYYTSMSIYKCVRGGMSVDVCKTAQLSYDLYGSKEYSCVCVDAYALICTCVST